MLLQHIQLKNLFLLIFQYEGHIDFEMTKEQMLALATRAGTTNLVGGEFVFFANVTDWYSGLNRTGWAGSIIYQDEIKMSWVGGNVKTFKPGSLLKIQV